MGQWRLLALLICVLALTQAIAQFCPAKSSIVHVGMLVVQPSQLPPRLEKYQGIPFLPIALGTGFVVSKDGYVITALHVIRRAETLGTEIPVAIRKLVVCANRPAELYVCNEVRIFAVDEHRELALLKMKSPQRIASLPPMQLSPTKPIEGTPVWAAGYPGDKRGLLVVASGTFLGAGQTSTAKASGAPITPDERFWLVEMTVENGDSGAPVYLQNGSVIGVIVNRSTTHAIAGFVPAQDVIALMVRSGIETGTTIE